MKDEDICCRRYERLNDNEKKQMELDLLAFVIDTFKSKDEYSQILISTLKNRYPEKSEDDLFELIAEGIDYYEDMQLNKLSYGLRSLHEKFQNEEEIESEFEKMFLQLIKKMAGELTLHPPVSKWPLITGKPMEELGEMSMNEVDELILEKWPEFRKIHLTESLNKASNEAIKDILQDLNFSEFINDQVIAEIENLLMYESQYKNNELTDDVIDKVIANYIESIKNGNQSPSARDVARDIVSIKTRFPTNFLIPTDKVTNLLFDGKIKEGKMNPIAMERKGSHKKITSLVSVNYEGLDGSIRFLNNKKEVNDYDWLIHSAVATSYIVGENEYITFPMIYETMTGNSKNFLNKQQAIQIEESVLKLMSTVVEIDATEEMEAYGKAPYLYKGNLLYAEMVEDKSINGKLTQCLHILKKPTLYEYADSKNQIDRININLLNTPLNKNTGTLLLQSYLFKRILAIKGSSKLSPNIVYDTLFKELNISASSDAALRKKQTKVRGQVKTILDFWVQEGFIKNYNDNKKGRKIYSVTINT